jgi:uncharacterized protein YjcR
VRRSIHAWPSEEAWKEEKDVETRPWLSFHQLEQKEGANTSRVLAAGKAGSGFGAFHSPEHGLGAMCKS